MAEKVRDGVDGLHFRVGDADALAETISRAVDAPGLWDEIRASIAEPHPMDRHLAAVTGIYSELLTRAPASSGDGISADATSVAS
jgi:glycosyltransferase involved in cell wall biosynthesis